jgi:hypothetical protein
MMSCSFTLLVRFEPKKTSRLVVNTSVPLSMTLVSSTLSLWLWLRPPYPPVRIEKPFAMRMLDPP